MEDKKRGYVGNLDVEGLSPKSDKNVTIIMNGRTLI